MAAIACLSAVALVPLPYYTLRGRVLSATRIVHVPGATTYSPTGQFLLPIVVAQHDTGLSVGRDWFDETAEVHATEDVFGGETPTESDRANLRLMSESKQVAATLALRTLGQDRSETLVDIDTGQLGGPSGGLAFTLALIDLLTPGELTGEHIVVATGTVSADGVVGPVGGVRLKTLAARAAGADMFLVPAADYREAVASAGTMPVVAVDSFDDALQILVVLGGQLTPAAR